MLDLNGTNDNCTKYSAMIRTHLEEYILERESALDNLPEGDNKTQAKLKWDKEKKEIRTGIDLVSAVFQTFTPLVAVCYGMALMPEVTEKESSNPISRFCINLAREDAKLLAKKLALKF